MADYANWGYVVVLKVSDDPVARALKTISASGPQISLDKFVRMFTETTRGKTPMNRDVGVSPTHLCRNSNGEKPRYSPLIVYFPTEEETKEFLAHLPKSDVATYEVKDNEVYLKDLITINDKEQ